LAPGTRDGELAMAALIDPTGDFRITDESRTDRR
jgi:hypothetical protein